MAETYSSANVRREVERIFSADEYDIAGITDAIVSQYGLAPIDDLDDLTEDALADIAMAHALPEQPDPADEFTRELQALIPGTPSGTPVVWERDGVRLEITGQSRVQTGTPTPGARIRLITPDSDMPVTARAWAQVWEQVQDAIDEWQASAEAHMRLAVAQQRIIDEAQSRIEHARRERNKSIVEMHRYGVTDYAISKKLGIGQPRVAAVHKAR
jgi:hypothetical protein